MPFRIHCVVLSITAAATVALAQTPIPPSSGTPPRDTSRPPPAGTAIIRGRVVDADTRRPLRRATIQGTAPVPGGNGHTISTNAAGQYELRNLPAGRYTLSISRAGYLTVQFGQRHPFEPGQPVDVTDGAVIEGVDIGMPRMGVISGHVLDETGDPIAGVLVRALRQAYSRGQRQWVPASGFAGTSDETGEYRMLDLAPGTYLVVATDFERWPVTDGKQTVTWTYVDTYFPSTTMITSASPLTVAAGQEVANTDISLVPGRTASVSGVALNAAGQPATVVALLGSMTGPFGGVAGLGGSGRVAADGTFTLRDAQPGDYELVATAPHEIVRLPITIDGTDVANVAVTTSPGGSITGRVVLPPGTTLPMERVTLTAMSTSGPRGVILGGVFEGQGHVEPNGRFTISTVIGPVHLLVNLPPGWVVGSVRQGDRDLTDTVLDVRGTDTLTDVDIVLSNRPARLTGRTVDPTGTPVTGATVLVVPADSSRWFEQSRAVHVGRSDQRGSVDIANVAPGAYFVVAIDSVETGTWNDPAFLEILRAHAQAVTLHEGESLALTLMVEP